jgi:hypothetical protein
LIPKEDQPSPSLTGIVIIVETVLNEKIENIKRLSQPGFVVLHLVLTE